MTNDPAVTRLASVGDADGDLVPGIGTASAPVAVANFRIVRLIGAGGMGAVYEAEQTMPRRTVALKVIRPGLATPELRRRFETEVQVLARLQHPGIAQIFQAGVADLGSGPQPFFAMELVKGDPLVEWVERGRLGTRDRLRLMADVCDAVEHAHQRGVIHRDLKPGNILVTSDSGRPKVLDFGVARATDSDLYATTHTELGQLVGTIPYMSPEQVGGRPDELDTRSDVYALGVVLFELLTGRLPYTINEASAFDAMHTIRDVEATRLTVLDRRYRGDVETIVAKALEKEKSRRYQSAGELAADIRRHLEDQPIVARPPSAAYQLRKFARRHRALVGGLFAAFVILTAGAIVSTMQAVRATRAERLASARLVEADQARAVAQQREADATAARQLADERRIDAETSFNRAEEARRIAEQQREANRRLLYVSDLTLAQRALTDGNHTRAVELLERHRSAAGAPDLRHFEWFYLWRASHLFERSLSHPTFTEAFDLAPDGRTAASGGADGSIRVWDVATGRERLARSVKGGISQIALSSDAARVAVGTRANAIHVIDVASGRDLAAFTLARLPGALRFAGGNLLAETTASLGVLRDLTSSREVFTDQGPQQVVPGGVGSFFISLRQGAPSIVSPDGELPLKLDDRIRNMAVSDDGMHVVTYTAAGTLALWTSRAEPVASFRSDRAVAGWMFVSAQGRYLAARTAPATVAVWDVRAGKVIASLAEPPGMIASSRAVRFSPSGRLLALSGSEGVVIFDVAANRAKTILRGHSRAGVDIGFAPDEQTVVTQGSDSVKVWRLGSVSTVDTPAGPRGQVVSVVVSPDGRWFASASDETQTIVAADRVSRTRVEKSVLQVWTMPGAATSRSIEIPAPVTAMATAGLRRLVAGDSAGRLYTWDPTSGAPATSVTAHAQGIGDVASSPDGTLVATTARPDEIRIWSVPQGRLAATFAHPSVNKVAFGPGGTMLATAGSDGAVRLWTIGGRTTPRVLRAHPGQIRAVAFSPDGVLVASGHVDGQIVLWDAASGREAARLRGHTLGVESISFSIDGRRLVSGGRDATVRIWDMATLSEVQHLQESVSAFNSVRLLPDGMGLIAGAVGTSPLLLWRAGGR